MISFQFTSLSSDEVNDNLKAIVDEYGLAEKQK